MMAWACAKTAQIDERKRKEAREERLSKPKNKYDAESQSEEHWRNWKHLQCEADMEKSFAEDADGWKDRYDRAEHYLEDRDNGYMYHTGEDRERPATGLSQGWFKGKK